MSESNRVDISYLAETTSGTPPGTGNYKKIPFTAAPDFSNNPQTTQSQEIRSDRMTDDLPLVGIEVGGSIDIEFQMYTYQELMEGAFFDTTNKIQSTTDPDSGAAKLTFSAATKIPSTFLEDSLLYIRGNQLYEGLWLVGDRSSQGATDVPVTRADGKTGAMATGQQDMEVFGVGVEGGSDDVVEAATPKTITLTGSPLAVVNAKDADNKSLQPGDWIGVLAGSVSPKKIDSGFYRITNVGTGGVLTYDSKIEQSEGWTSPIAPGKTRIFFSDTLKNGVTKKSFTLLERFHTVKGPPVGGGLAAHAQSQYSGCFTDMFNLSFESQAIVTGSFNFMGFSSKYLSTIIPDGRIIDEPQEKILNSSSNIGKVYLGEQEVTGPNYIESASFSLNNNSRRQNAVGSIGSIGIAGGTCDITGNLTTYFGNVALAQDVINNTEKSFKALFADGLGKRMLLDIPRIKFSSGSPGVPGKNEDIKVPLEYQALRHETLNYQAKICTFRYA